MGGGESKPEAKLPDLDAKRFRKYNFPFENIVMEGGGAKGIAYIGAVKVLEDAGIMKNIKRFAGTSAGAITAGFLAAGMSSGDVLDVMNKTDMPNVLEDGRYWAWKHVGAVWDLWKTFPPGLYKGQSFLEWYGETLRQHFEKKSKESDEMKERYQGLTENITFAQLYEALGVEFCTVAYNTQIKQEGYLHVKTIPLGSLREAVRMSISLPVVYRPYKVGGDSRKTGAYWIDGGVCANNPVYCFDGWWLSMEERNCFHSRLGETQDSNTVRRVFRPAYSHERFEPDGDEEQKKAKRSKTLGLLLYSDGDPEFYQHKFTARISKFTAQHQELEKDAIKPDTEKRRKNDKNMEEREPLERAKKETLMKQGGLKPKLDKVKEQFPNEDKMRACFRTIMTKEDLQIIKSDLDMSDEEKAFKDAFDRSFLNWKGKPTKGTTENIFNNSMPLRLAMLNQLKYTPINETNELYMSYLDFVGKSKPIREHDVGRCVGIDVDYVSTGDFDMEPEDKTFLMMQGAIATVAFLEEFIKENGLKPESKKPESKKEVLAEGHADKKRD
ncbi:uncharacterized protein LOC144885550 [Branchiostoma floridae x Branchiostoma japonicum]